MARHCGARHPRATGRAPRPRATSPVSPSGAAQDQRDAGCRAWLPLCGSPLIAAEGTEWRRGRRAGAQFFMDYVPSTWPGVRLPHVWLADGTQCRIGVGYGHGYTLLRFAGNPRRERLGCAFATRARRMRCSISPTCAPATSTPRPHPGAARPARVWRGNALAGRSGAAGGPGDGALRREHGSPSAVFRASESGEPEIHNHGPGVWIPGSRAKPAPRNDSTSRHHRG